MVIIIIVIESGCQVNSKITLWGVTLVSHSSGRHGLKRPAPSWSHTQSPHNALIMLLLLLHRELEDDLTYNNFQDVYFVGVLLLFIQHHWRIRDLSVTMSEYRTHIPSSPGFNMNRNVIGEKETSSSIIIVTITATRIWLRTTRGAGSGVLVGVQSQKHTVRHRHQCLLLLAGDKWLRNEVVSNNLGSSLGNWRHGKNWIKSSMNWVS